MAIAKDVKEQKLVNSLLTCINGSFGYTLTVLCQDLATRNSCMLKLLYMTLLGAHCVDLQEAIIGVSQE